MAAAPWFATLGRSPQLQHWAGTPGSSPIHVPALSVLCPPGVPSVVCMGAGGPPGRGGAGGSPGGRGSPSFGGMQSKTGKFSFQRRNDGFTFQRRNQPAPLNRFRPGGPPVEDRPGFREAPKPQRGKQNTAPVVMNFAIKVPEVRVILQDKSPLGVMPTQEALKKAQEDEKDLIMINPQGVPPLVRIVEYSKFKFENEKQQKEKKAQQRENKVEVKEVKLKPNIATHDYDVKMRNALKFIEKDGDKVKVLVQMRGAEMFKENGRDLLKKFIADVGDRADVELAPRQSGRDFFTVLAPAKKLKGQGGGPKKSKYAAKQAKEGEVPVAQQPKDDEASVAEQPENDKAPAGVAPDSQ